MPVPVDGSQLELAPAQAAPAGIETAEDEHAPAVDGKRKRQSMRLALRRATRSTRHTAGVGSGGPSNTLAFERLEAVYRQEPILRRAIQKWAGAIVREWFMVVDPESQQKHEKFDAEFQAWARQAKLKSKAKSVLVASRVYGDGLFEFEWADDAPADAPLEANTPLLDVHTVDPVTAKLREVEDESGDLRVMLIQRVGQRKIVLHPDRVRHIVIDRLEGRLRGLSACEVAFHNAISKIQGDQAAGEILFHAGVPIRHIQVAEGDDEDVQFYTEMLKDPKFTRGFATDDSVDMEQYNPVVVDPSPFYANFLMSVAAAVGLPEMMVRGAQAGQVTGSETNIEDFHADVSEVRENVLDDVLEEIVAGVLGIEKDQFDIKWNPFPRNKESEAKTWRELANAANVLINLCRVDPVAAFRILKVEDVQEKDFVAQPKGVMPPVGRAPE